MSDNDSDHKKIMSILSDIKVDTAVLVEKVSRLEDNDAGTRLTKLEARNKYEGIIVGVLISLVAVKDYLIQLLFG